MSYINVDKVIDCLCEPLRTCLKDKDPYVRKTAAVAVGKLYFNDKEAVVREGLLDQLRSLLSDANATVPFAFGVLIQVVANALAALMEIHQKSDDVPFAIDQNAASNIVTALSECSECTFFDVKWADVADGLRDICWNP
jgi:vesicle coat complex subunit